MPDISPLDQLRAERRQKLECWLAGVGFGERWPGDDGRELRLDEAPWWPEVVSAAESAYFDSIDAEFDAAKAEL